MLKQWLIDNGYLKAGAQDSEIDEAAQKAMSDGKLSLVQYKELADAPSKEDQIKQGRDELAKAISTPINENMTKSFDKLGEILSKGLAGLKAPEGDEEVEDEVTTPDEAKSLSDEDLEAKFATYLEKQGLKKDDEHSVRKVLKEAAVLNDEKHPETIRVKRSVERFSDTKGARKYASGLWKGQEMTLDHRGGQVINEASQRDNALFHVFAKSQMNPNSLTESDKDLLCYIVEKMEWVGLDAEDTTPRKMRPDEVALWKHRINTGWKAPLLDDSTSGGQEAVPEFFDTNAILVPILEREISPWVNIIEVPRGSSVESYQMGKVTVTKVAEGTEATVFDATSLVSDFSLSFYPAQVFVEVGRDFLADATPRVGRDLQTQMSREFGAWMDEQIVSGDGTTEPQGILNASGTVGVSSIGGAAGPLEIGDLVNLILGVDKAHRTGYDASRANFAMSETTYNRFRALPIGPADERLLLGAVVDDYVLLGKRVGNPDYGMDNQDIIFCQFGGYRWYRRQGVRFGMEDRGDHLVRANTAYMYARTRAGGKLERGAYAAIVTDAMS